jgi:nicotinamidase-related amidase
MPTALLIIDVQAGLCTGRWAAFDIDSVVDRINLASAKARAAGAPVFLIQHEDDGPLRHGTPGWELYDRLVVDDRDLRLRKTATDSFHKTSLDDQLRRAGVSRLIVCGLQSDFCIDTTIRRALALGYPVDLVADGHTTVDNTVLKAPQIIAHHTETLANIESFGPRVTPVLAADLQVEA